MKKKKNRTKIQSHADDELISGLSLEFCLFVFLFFDPVAKKTYNK